jgi:multimeric flavodoxin WrbA
VALMPADDQRRVLVLGSSPRHDGNSWMLTEALIGGARKAGHAAEAVDLGEAMSGGMLRDCRKCRQSNGSCSIDDSLERVVYEQLAKADALVYATPLYWYGMSATLKNFFDRMICYMSASNPRSTEVVEKLRGKRVALLISSEERYPASPMSLILQIQEISRYMYQPFVGVVQGFGNKRGEVQYDPLDPVGAAAKLGADIFGLYHSDYQVDTDRPNAVWEEARQSGLDLDESPYADI